MRSASSASSISSTFSAFRSPDRERLKLPRNTVSSATVSFACMKLCSPPPGRQGSDRLPENSPCITRSSSGSFHATLPFWRHW